MGRGLGLWSGVAGGMVLRYSEVLVDGLDVDGLDVVIGHALEGGPGHDLDERAARPMSFALKPNMTVPGSAWFV